MRTHQAKIALPLVGFLLGLSASQGAVHAQEEARENAKQADEAVLVEILVTASKREQTTREIPFSLSSISGDHIDDIGAAGFQDFALLTPSLDVNSTVPGQNRITMRGISARDGASTIGIYMDETPITAGQETQMDAVLYDLERVEVLRGPQGTLYGEGAIGGTIRLITNKPDLNEYQFKANTNFSNTRNGGSNYAVDAVANLPLVEDRFGVRVLLYDREDEGFVDNIATGDNNANTAGTTGGKLALRATPNDRLTIDASVLWNELDVDGVPIVVAGDGFTQNRPLSETSNDESTIASLTIEYVFDSMLLTSNISWFDREQFTSAYTPVFGGVAFEINEEFTVLAHETRLTSLTDSPFQWVVGAFYKETDLDTFSPVSGVIGVNTLGPLFALTDGTNENTQMALFGEASYQLTETFTVLLGLRAYREEYDIDQTVSGLLVGPDARLIRDEEIDVLIPKLAATLELSDNATAYANITKGFRAGGVNGNPLATPGSAESYDEDSVWNYELGVKGIFFDSKMSMDLALFYIDYSDYQSNIEPALAGGGVIDNVGDASSYGFEWDITTRPIPELTLSLSGNLTETEIDDDVVGFGPTAGNRLPLAPEYKVNLSGQYESQLTDNLSGFVRASVSFVGNTYERIGNVDENESYNLVNLRLGVQSERYSLALYAENLLDEEYTTRNLGEIPGVLDFGVFAAKPRTLGVRLGINY